MKKLSIAFLLVTALQLTCHSQHLKITWDKLSSNENGAIYKFKIYNNSSAPIAIKSSALFNNFSEIDTLNLAIGDWDWSSDSNCYYGIHKSDIDARLSDQTKYYQLLILNPQTYLIFNANFKDYRNCGKKIKFLVFYTETLSEEEKEKFTKRQPGLNKVIDTEKKFLIQELSLN